jgi:pimeloyl-ACP methyl ester carboxylesterase
MEDYVADVESVATQVTAAKGSHPVIAGWSMGGLVALMYTARHQEAPALVTFSPTPPLEVGGKASIEEIRNIPPTPVGPDYYGIYPHDLEASRPAVSDLTDDEAMVVLEKSRGALESGFARRQRHRGISVPPGAVRAPSLVVYGEAEAEPRPTHARRLAIYLGGEALAAPGAGHWGIVHSDKAVSDLAPRVDGWLRRELRA